MNLLPEQVDHINFVNWFDYNFPQLKDDLHHFANERKCSVSQGRLLKRMGVKKGVFDFFLATPIRKHGKCLDDYLFTYHGFWMELKTVNGKKTPEQIQFGKRKEENGYNAVFAFGLEEAKQKTLNYLSSFIRI